MRLWREIYEQLSSEQGEEGALNAFALQYTVAAGQGGYFQNVKGIVGFTSEEVTLRLARGSLKIAGKGLKVRKYCENDVLIGGDILSVIREQV
ncbi:MAG: YabP/YqfC family sporulation protein [Clostridia bacterium]|nr:YabP/YqfC family sporulation protein [Clostridia bacterium]